MNNIRVGVKGAGQLAQMLAQSSKSLNITLRSAGKESSSAFSDAEAFTKDLESTENLNEFLDGVDVFTFESEHEGLEIVDVVEKRKIPIYPPFRFVKIAGDRLLEKTELQNLSIPTADFREIDSELTKDELEEYLNHLLSKKILSELGIVIKTRHGGYDGKGQWVLTGPSQVTDSLHEIYDVIAKPGCIVEGLVDFAIEVSIIGTRSIDGDLRCWPLTHNVHQDSILKYSFSPITNIKNLDFLQNQAENIVRTLCEKHEYVGTIAIECFVTKFGLIVNEIAPRVHNSGHWTIEGSETSQFEQHMRAISSLELGPIDTKGFCTMINLVGIEVDKSEIEKLENVYLHWYGKEVRPKRKVGHITVVGNSSEHRDELVSKVKEIVGVQ